MSGSYTIKNMKKKTNSSLDIGTHEIRQISEDPDASKEVSINEDAYGIRESNFNHTSQDNHNDIRYAMKTDLNDIPFEKDCKGYTLKTIAD